MLTQLTIRNYVVVKELDLELRQGMGVITGETGAGKSILLDALNLALGGRAEASAVRPGAARAEILASFDVSGLPEARDWLKAQQLDQEDPGECLLRRVISSEGRSRAYINGTPCPLSALRALSTHLIEIHSQHAHHSLLKPAHHLKLLDEFAGLQELAGEVRSLSSEWQQINRQLQQQRLQAGEREAHLQLLNYQLEELDKLGLAAGELETLEAEHQQLAHVSQFQSGCQQALDLLGESESASALSLLRRSQQALEQLPGDSATVASICELLQSAAIHMEEARSDLEYFQQDLQADPQRLEQLEQRLERIHGLARKHHVSPPELPAHHQRLRAEIEQLSGIDAARDEQEARLQTLQDRYRSQSEQLSRQRHKSARELARQVEEEIQRLGMPDGRFEVQLQPIETGNLPAQGAEQAVFRVSSNPGQPPLPLQRIASGGEISRISLAIQVTTARTTRSATLVFDEVDVGIGGPTAEIVGIMLRQLGDSAQVLVVTHLPQVAAKGHFHLQVHKQRSSRETQTTVRLLDEGEQVREIARMLGGIDLTDQSIAHARQMLAAASGSGA